MDKFSWRRFVEVISKKYTRFSEFNDLINRFYGDICWCVGKSEDKIIADSSYDFYAEVFATLSLRERAYIFKNTNVLVEKDISIPDLYAPIDYLYNVPILSTPDDIIKTSDKLNELLFYSIFVSEKDDTTWGEVAEYIEDKDAINYLKETQIDRRCLISIDKAKEELNDDFKRLLEKFK
jgi:hypothetical protein